VTAVRVAAYGFFGIGNLGNEASLRAFVDSTRRRHPDARVTCYAVDDARVRREHGIASAPLASRSFPGDDGGPLLLLRKALARLSDVPHTYRLLDDVDVVVMPGTGSLESKLPTGTFGLPYWLFLVGIMCRVRRRRFALVSVGAEESGPWLMRFFFRWAVRLSHYCSVRDDRSLRALRAIGVGARIGTYPDLVFALRRPVERVPRSDLVVMGVMDYPGARSSPDFGDRFRHALISSLSRAVTGLVDRGRSVCLVIGDDDDRDVAIAVQDQVRADRPVVADARVRVSPAGDMAGVMDEMSAADVVVATRYHTLVGGLMLAKPTISLAYAEKHACLLDDFGLSGFGQSLDDFDPDLLLLQVDEVAQGQAGREPRMKETLDGYAAALAAQDAELDRLFAAAVPNRRDARRRGLRR
jgi:polysaccharide pyruvyl transferase WcaK-like protein